MKLSGLVSPFGQSIPIELIVIGNQLGHWKLEPFAPPMLSETLKPLGLVWN